MPFKIIKATAPFPFQVCNSLGMPHVELTLFACNAGKYLSETTAKSYTREIVHFASWIETDILCKRQGWTLLSSPEQIRALIIHFLNSKVKCVVAIGRDRAGFDTRRIEPTWETSRPVAKLFAALRIFFEFLIERKLYAQQNPMEGDNAKELIAEQIKSAKAAFVSIHGRNPMPQESGVDDIRNIRSVASYFRNTSKGWLPEILDSPSSTTLLRVESAGDGVYGRSLLRVFSSIPAAASMKYVLYRCSVGLVAIFRKRYCVSTKVVTVDLVNAYTSLTKHRKYLSNM